jgi:hypothetical protein
VDQEDFGLLQKCLSGSVPIPAGCLPADLNNDGLIDQEDVGLFQQCLSGPKIPPPPNCGQ